MTYADQTPRTSRRKRCTAATQLRASIVRQLYRRSGATGQIQLPAVPGLIDEYVTMCDTIFGAVGRRFTAEELAHLQAVLEDQLAQAYAASPRSMITISYNAPGHPARRVRDARRPPAGLSADRGVLAHDGYTPDDAARELGQQSYTSMFTRDEMATAAAGLPLTLLADDSVHDYEKQHLREGAWPQTNWYPNWTAGQDVFDLQRQYCPIDMLWLVYRKTG
jgi:hypothetical protein